MSSMPLVAEISLGIFTVYVLLIATILVHEAGHFVGGFLTGLVFVRLGVGPVEIYRTKGLKVRWQSQRLFSGVTAWRASSLDQSWLVARFAIAILCGPLANALTACICLLLSFKQGSIPASILLWVAGANLIICLANLLPVSGKIHDSDGKKLTLLLFRKDRRDGMSARLTYLLRLAEFKTAFRAGDIAVAVEHLNLMEKVCTERSVGVLMAINRHLREHLISGESLDDCLWEPPKTGALPLVSEVVENPAARSF